MPLAASARSVSPSMFRWLTCCRRWSESATGEVDLADQHDGRSLVAAQGRRRNAKNESVVLGELLSEGAIAPLLMIRRGRYKYVFSEPDPEQLYDLVDDPHELHNLATQPDHAQRIQAFRAELAERWDAEAPCGSRSLPASDGDGSLPGRCCWANTRRGIFSPIRTPHNNTCAGI